MLTTILCIIVSTLAIICVILHFFGNRELYNKTNHFSGPLLFPLIGCTYQFIGDSEHFLKQTTKLSCIFESPVRLAFGSHVFIATKDPQQSKTILQSSKAMDKTALYNFSKSWIGDGLVTSKQNLWRKHRRIIQPMFNKKTLQTYFSIFQQNSLLLNKTVESEIDGPEFDISNHIAYITCSNICESSMGVSVKTQKEEVYKFYEISDRIFRVLFKRLLSVWYHSELLFSMSSLAKNYNNDIKNIHNFTDNVILKRKAILQNKKEEAKAKNITLDLLLELSDNNSLTNKQLRDHVLTLITAGTDTTSRTLAFVLQMLAQNPKVQEKVYQEIFNIYGSDDPEKNPVKYEDLQHFMYLERVIKETMRLFSIAPFLARMITEDLELDGKKVPKGCTAIVAVVPIHRDEKIWPDPLKFDPDRFLPEEVSKRHPCAFIPFSFGPRDCIGRAYAMLSMKVIMVTFLRKYILKKDKFTEIKDIKLKMDHLFLSCDPITVRIENRAKCII
ncbi:cytochrome P450 4C1-like [Leptopilina heterotoma]|uniref:cytochrome P450 4C1-like n=1 Tax=Leptopilina heterotoma TaxID=63436 RepID=UPI001CAA0444|nr:cytochrome P450 4C1-like [Leptopilina heterotoma]